MRWRWPNEGVPLIFIQRQLGHSYLGITSIYLQGIDKRRDHRHRPPPQRADGPGQRLTSALNALPAPLIGQGLTGE